MRFGFSLILCSGLFFASCISREFNVGSNVKDSANIGSAEKDSAKTSKAFNAFILWRDGKGALISDYPASYDERDGEIVADGVFYVGIENYWRSERFIGSVTEGVTVEGNLLTYPTKEGRTLSLKFSAPAKKEFTHEEAVLYCKAAGLRLPHIQELLDFCAAGTAKDRTGGYKDNRCREYNLWWSASLVSTNRAFAWQFGDFDGSASNGTRLLYNGVRCVGEP